MWDGTTTPGSEGIGLMHSLPSSRPKKHCNPFARVKPAMASHSITQGVRDKTRNAIKHLQPYEEGQQGESQQEEEE